MRFSTIPQQYQYTVRSKIQDLRDRSRRERTRCLDRGMTPVVANVWDKCLAKIDAAILADDLTEGAVDDMISLNIIDFMDDNMCGAFGR